MGAARAVFALAALLIVGPILGTARFVASGQAKLATIREREAELSRLSWRLEFALAASNVGVWDVDLGSDELLWDARAQRAVRLPRPHRSVLRGGLGRACCTPTTATAMLAEAAEAIAGNGRSSPSTASCGPTARFAGSATWRRCSTTPTAAPGWSA